jgi:CDP-4-dehydro-6-deoxyglucose reductase
MGHVTLINGKQFTADATTTILEAALGQDVVLEYSCRTGRCGICKARVLSGGTIVLKPEESLPANEVNRGMILTCCRAAEGDVALDAEDLAPLTGITVRTMPCKIAAITFPAPDIAKVTLRTPPTMPLVFLAGQYVDILFRGIRRSYSLANAPRADGTLELIIKRYPGGMLSRYWFEEAAVGDLLRLEGPLGTFFLREQPVDHLVLLATGTGIAPVKAILEQLSMQAGPAPARISVYWGNRDPAEFCIDFDCSTLDFSANLLLSGRNMGTGHREGYVQHAVIDDAVDLGRAAVYACGSNAMITSARTLLTEAGLPQRRFFSDAFVSSN